MVSDSQNQVQPEIGKGLGFGLIAYLIWGSFPLVIGGLEFASPWEVVVWRIVFGFATAAIIITATRGWRTFAEVLKSRRNLIWLAVAAVFILVNWQVYVIGVQSHRVVETALGYFINPLVTILLAVVFLRERLRPLQWAAVAMGAIAVTVLTFDYGRLPWIALTLAASFGIYGLAKNKLGGKVSPLNSFAYESGMVLPIALVQGIWVAAQPAGMAFGSAGPLDSIGLASFGVLTAIPLILFGAAAKRLPLSYIGFMQYLTPVIQFTLALTVFREPMPPARWIGFGLVWVGLVLLSSDAVRQRSRSKNRM